MKGYSAVRQLFEESGYIRVSSSSSITQDGNKTKGASPITASPTWMLFICSFHFYYQALMNRSDVYPA